MKIAWCSVLLFLLPACLENEEELEVHPDGSVEVTLASRGDLADLAEGDPIPLTGPWLPISEDARRWVQRVGPNQGRAVRERVREGDWPGTKPGETPQAKLVVQAHFGSVEDLPRWYAPMNEAYREANLARDTSLSIEERGNGRLYTFERVYRGLERARFDPLRQGDLPEDLEQRLEAHTLTPADRALVVEIVTTGHARAAEALTRDALLGLFLDGRSELPASRLPGLIEEIRSASSNLVTAQRIERLLVLVEEDDEAAGTELEALERDWRDVLRAALDAALAQREVPVPLRNAAAFALEWRLAAFDHSEDLGDESFRLRVRLPGTLVGGNFGQAEDGVAVFEFKGKALQEGDVVLRAVSVLE